MISQDLFSKIAQTNLSLPFRLSAAGYIRNPVGYFTEESSHCEIIFCLRGKGLFRINSQPEFVIQANQLVIITPSISFEYKSLDEKWEIATVRFDCNLMLLLQFRLKMNRPVIVNSSDRILELIDALCMSEDYRDRSLKTSEIIYSLLVEAKLQTIGLHVFTINPNLTIQKVVNFIYDHYSSKLKVDEISRMVGYTSQHLNKLFKNELGHSIYQYILKVQLEQAACLLETEEMTVEQVAENIGMESRSFYRLFQRRYKVSPGQFRREMRKSM
ncbi:AraC-like DNA-binding protein [Paenibacillus sp. V4I3]|uniref:AraC family transcriptional regulator n=1 Tax=Paenibacillus sp. V4I3 TaxID=3042305 RepID=UPI0027895E07|nr:AraC family transcriptional regulator [Paenibacillus sp. V4I3]MDQ0877759.1 AraC-like DNA-binding protein [Paenibacillus sp. V4I3]